MAGEKVVLTSVSQFVSEYWRLALKLLSLGITAALGVIGLLNDFKDKDRNLTKWGKISLIGLVAAALVGVGTQIIDSLHQAEQSRREAARAQEQLDRAQKQLDTAIKTELEVQTVLAGNREVQSKADATLKQQSKLFDANQLTLHEVERGLTPLGSHISVDYELVVTSQNREFNTLRHRIDADVAEFEAKPKPPHDTAKELTGRAKIIAEMPRPVAVDGLILFGSGVTLRDDYISQNARVLKQVLTHVPFNVSLWRKRPLLKSCRPSPARPNLLFIPDIDAKRTNTYVPAEKALLQEGSAGLRRDENEDDGTITSALDFSGAFSRITIIMSSGARLHDRFAAGLEFRRLTLHAGHFIVSLNPNRPVQRCGSDLYFQLPNQLKTGD